MKYLVLGSNGQLAKEFILNLNKLNLPFEAYDLDKLDISDYQQLNYYISKIKPDIVLNCASFNDTVASEENPTKAIYTNSVAPIYLSLLSNEYNFYLVHFSTDYVFAGDKYSPYLESDLPLPLNNYGITKLIGETEVLKINPKNLVIRISWLYGDGKQNFIYKVINWSKNNQLIKIVDDEISTPTSTSTVVKATIRSIEKKLNGIYHIVNNGYCSRYEWAKKIIEIFNLNCKVEPIKFNDIKQNIIKPKYSVLSNEKIKKELNIEIEYWEKELERFIKEKWDNKIPLFMI